MQEMWPFPLSCQIYLPLHLAGIDYVGSVSAAIVTRRGGAVIFPILIYKIHSFAFGNPADE
jgi:hypothetical protein